MAPPRARRAGRGAPSTALHAALLTLLLACCAPAGAAEAARLRRAALPVGPRFAQAQLRAEGAAPGPGDWPRLLQIEQGVGHVDLALDGAKALDSAKALDGRRGATRHSYLVTMLPVLGVAVAAVLCMVYVSTLTKRQPAAQAARTCYLVINPCLVMCMSIVIVDSYSLCQAFGLSATDSGQMVGEYYLGSCLGALGVWFLAISTNHLWQHRTRQVLAAGIAIQLIGSTIYTLMARTATLVVTSADWNPAEKELNHFAYYLLLARIVSGFGAGTAQQCYVSAMLHITPASGRPGHTTRWILSTMVSFGMGPLLAALLEVFVSPEYPAFEFVGYVQLILTACAMFAAVALHPSLAGVKDCAEDEVDEPAHGSASAALQAVGGSPSSLARLSQKRKVVVGCLAMTLTRAYLVTSSEVVIVQLLEEKYHFGHSSIGAALGLVFLLMVPMKMAYDVTPSTATWVRLLSVASFLGSLMLLRPVGAMLEAGLRLGGGLELIAAALLYLPTLSLGDALSLGVMHQHILPHGSLLDANHTNLWYNVFVGLARFGGPWLGRAVLTWSYDFWVAQHLAAIGFFTLMFELLVAPNALSFDPPVKDEQLLAAATAAAADDTDGEQRRRQPDSPTEAVRSADSTDGR